MLDFTIAVVMVMTLAHAYSAETLVSPDARNYSSKSAGWVISADPSNAMSKLIERIDPKFC